MISKSKNFRIMAILVAFTFLSAIFFFHCRDARLDVNDIASGYREGSNYKELRITYPLDSALFPVEIAAPTFTWKDSELKSNAWLIIIRFQKDEDELKFLCRKRKWTPEDEEWEIVKTRSRGTYVRVTILGVDSAEPQKVLTSGNITFGTAVDEVGAPLFFREVNLPFIDAVKDPTQIRWRFGSISSRKPPPVVLEKLPVCGNCHSFSADGKVMGMDVDYANDKGSYALVDVQEEMILDSAKIITWADYKREDGELTFGLLSQVSPNGRYAVSTVKDRSVFVATPGLEYSQLFFPVKGILAVYDRRRRTFRSLPGADHKRYVQSNPDWSPSGEHIVFTKSRSHAFNIKGDKVLLTEEECRVFLEKDSTFLFDLYRIPFNSGKGGTAEPLQGASNNGMSNYFARHSPDGKWIVFCKAKSFSLLQPDSKLYIIPADGGEARLMKCNTSRMNSWHSWSPNGKWLVFSSKMNGPYTQLWLTHIDDKGNSTPPVVLDRLTARDRAANIPEFVNTHPQAIKTIQEKFLNDISFIRAGNEFIDAGDYAGAEGAFRKAMVFNPKSPDVNFNLATVLLWQGKIAEAKKYFRKTLEFDPKNLKALSNLGATLLNQDSLQAAKKYFLKTVKLYPQNAKSYNNLAILYSKQRKPEQAARYYKKALALAPQDPNILNNLGTTLGEQGKLKEAYIYLSRALKLSPDNAELHLNTADILSAQGKFAKAINHYQEAINRFAGMLQANPGRPDIRDNLGLGFLGIGKILYKQQKFKEANDLFNRASKISPLVKQHLDQSRHKYMKK